MAIISSKALRLDRERNNLTAEAEIADDLPSALVQEWRSQLWRYQNYWSWMDGRVWETVDIHANVQQGKAPPLLFPVQLNPIYTAAIIHRNTLWGETPDTGVPLVRPLAIPKRHGDVAATNRKSAKKDAQFVNDVLEAILYQSNSRSEFIEAGFVTQTLGGCVFKISYEPWNKNLMDGLPVAFRQIEPEYFLPIYTLSDRWHLREARLGRMIDAYEAKEIYGVDVSKRDRILYLEKWKRNSVSVTVDGKPATIRMGDARVELSQKTDFGLVPFVYIPHEVVGQFYGVPIVQEIANLLKDAALCSSTSESMRMIQQGAVKIDGDKVSDKSLRIVSGTEAVFQVGKRKFARVTIS